MLHDHGENVLKGMVRPHPLVPNSTSDNWLEMLRELGIETVDDLYSDVPEKFLLRSKLDLPGQLSEAEVYEHISKILDKNKSATEMPVFLGAGAWFHYVPAVVSEIISRSEFLTSYTPYQPEASQGILTALFEYQSLLAELLEMDVVNASLYDWATALGEAGRMAGRLTGRSEVLVPEQMCKDRRDVLETYLRTAGMKTVEVGNSWETGQLEVEDLKWKISSRTAAVYLENPSYFGTLQRYVVDVEEVCHDAGALFLVGADLVSLGILRAPGNYGADVVVAEGQPLGNHVNFGGPMLGVMACRDDMKMIRAMPGRVIGMTKTMNGGGRAFVMSLQTREQHIRRERATSNICTNQSLCALASAVYLSLLGKTGMRNLGEHILAKTLYASERLNSLEGVIAPLFDGVHFKEFIVNFEQASLDRVSAGLLSKDIQGGKDLRPEFPRLGQSALFCVTEVHSKLQIDTLVEAVAQIVGEH